MLSQKICLSVLAISLGGTAYSADAPNPPQRFDPAAAMQRLRDLKAQSQIVVRGNVEESIRKNREAEAEALRKMQEAGGKIEGQMGQMSQEATRMMQQLELYRNKFIGDIQQATDIDQQLHDSLLEFKGLLDEAKGLGQEFYDFQKARAKEILEKWLLKYQQAQRGNEDAIRDLLFEMGVIER